MPSMTAAGFWFMFLASLAVGGKDESVKFQIPGTVNDRIFNLDCQYKE